MMVIIHLKVNCLFELLSLSQLHHQSPTFFFYKLQYIFFFICRNYLSIFLWPFYLISKFLCRRFSCIKLFWWIISIYIRLNEFRFDRDGKKNSSARIGSEEKLNSFPFLPINRRLNFLINESKIHKSPPSSKNYDYLTMLWSQITVCLKFVSISEII